MIWFCAGSPLNQEGVKYDGGPDHIDPTFEKIEEVSIKLLLMHADEMRIDWQISQFLQDGNFGWRDCRVLEAVTMRARGGGSAVS